MTQRRKDLALGDETPMQLLGVGTVAQQLDGHLAPEFAVDALREINDTHPATTELAHDAIRADEAVNQWFGARRRHGGKAPLENSGRGLVRGDERVDFGAKLCIVSAALTQPRGTLIDVEVEHVLEYFLDLGAAGRRERHRRHDSGSDLSKPRSARARYSHARAFTQSRRTVRSVTPKTSAISRSSMPPKKRHSTTWRWRGSSESSASLSVSNSSASKST